MKKILVLIPTYNEYDNISILLKRIFSQKIPNLQILFVDDNSSDGTRELIEKYIKEKKVFLLKRESKLGIGSAHLEGMNWAYHQGYTRVITMDCDLTHSPKYFSSLIKASKNYDLVIASRHLAKDSMKGWSFFRKAANYTSHLLIKVLFSINYDAANSYRIYRLDNIPKGIFKLIRSSRYSFFFESLIIMKMNNCKIGEIPITLKKRVKGRSKMGWYDIVERLKMMGVLYLRVTFNKGSLILKK